MKTFAAKFAADNPDSPYAAEFKVQIRKASSALSDAKHAFRQALGLVALEARRGAEDEMRTHHAAMRPGLDRAQSDVEV